MGVVIKTTRKGNGTALPKEGDTVTVHMLGKLKSGGSVFDDTKKGSSGPLECVVGSAIKGVNEALLKMSCGECATVQIPAEDAYGVNGTGDDIPPNADLVYALELLTINGIQRDGNKPVVVPEKEWKMSSFIQIVMVPLMIGFQKLDITADSPMMFYLRIAYGVVLVLNLSVLGYIYTRISTTDDETEIYTQPLEDKKSLMSKDSKQPFAKTTYRKVETAVFFQTLQQEVFGVAISLFLHLYFEFTAIPLMQCLYLPANLWDHDLFKIHIRGTIGDGGYPRKSVRMFKERYPGETLETVAQLKEKGKEVQECRVAMGKAMETCWQAKAEDEGIEEMHEDMIECIQDVGINFKLNFKKEGCNDARTVIMQIAGTTTLQPGKVDKLMEGLLKMTKPTKPKLFIKDNDGWTAIHWAAFHGNAGALSQLLRHDTEMCGVICTWKDSDGFTPLGLARDQNNLDCVKVLEAFTSSKKNN